MPSTFLGITIAASGMSAYSAGLNTTGHNVANSKTVGYSKQTVEQKAKEALSLKTSYGMIGTGVFAYDITSSRDAYYDYKYRKSNSVLGKYDTQFYYMNGVQDSFYAMDAKSGGVSNSLDSFFANISALSENVPDKTVRTQVTGFAESMMAAVREAAESLLKSQTEINTEIENTVGQINAYATQIASLTQQINTLEVYGSKANDLRDRRATLVDELSLLVDVEVIEQAPADGQGLNQYLVFIGDGVLVDTNVYHQLELVTRTTKDNQNDAEGLYDLRWSTGQKFNIRNTNLGGRLQALFDVRDGNNEENFRATLDTWKKNDARYGGASTITLKAEPGTNASSLAKLNIPESDALLTIANFDYEYDYFEVTVDADGFYTYTFVLKEEMEEGKVTHLEVAKNADRTDVTVGDAIAFRGIPYYMAQLNEFVRTFSASFNQIQNTGYDLYDNLGSDLFVAKGIASGKEYDMAEFLYNKNDNYYYLNGCKVLVGSKWDEYTDGCSVEPLTDSLGPGYYLLRDSEGNEVEIVYKQPAGNNTIFTFASNDTVDQDKVSYYNMTALSCAVSTELMSDSKLLACNSKGGEGVSEGGNLLKMLKIREDNTMFKQGTASSFIAVVVTTVGVDGTKLQSSAKNALDITNAADNRRLSKSGVDEDEEGQNLIEYRMLLNYQYRVLSVMNEVLNKLINETAI